jgi:hypothetical protein
MPWTTDSLNIFVERDENDNVRLLEHLRYPFTDQSTNSPHELAAVYLWGVRALLALPDSAIEHLKATIPHPWDGPGKPTTNKGLQLRWERAFSIREETTVLLIQQTQTVAEPKGPDAEGIDVEFAGLRLLVHIDDKGSRRITGITSTLVYEPIEVPESSRRLVKGSLLLGAEKVNAILANFGLSPLQLHLELRATRFLHRFLPQSGLEGLRQPEQPLIAGHYYIANAIRSISGGPGNNPSAYDLTVREWDYAPMRVEVLLSHAASTNTQTGLGLAFIADPVSATGDFALQPNASPVSLDGNRSYVALPNLAPPPTGKPWSLSGKHVHMNDGSPRLPGWIGIKPPTLKQPFFAFRSRTNEFAAVNAYYHLDRMFEIIESMGMPFSSFPMGYKLPVHVMHRAALHPGVCSDGKCVNAQVQILPGYPNPTVYISFALADLSRNPGSADVPVEPLGIACDARIVWHEFCHALIAASTNFLEFPFAHSAGDALAAINGDPESHFNSAHNLEAFRGLTYPWGKTSSRRHDRLASEGWSWSSALGQKKGYENDIRDMFGYAREQVLSSTLFRLYRSIGGDAMKTVNSPDQATRAAAATYATYLIVRAIFSLGPRRTVPANTADALEAALAEADVGSQTVSDGVNRLGGTVHKVIRWAFEKQGLHGGRAQPIDVYVDNARKGEYSFDPHWQASPRGIWNSTTPNPLHGDQAPLIGQDNYLFVRVKNRGHLAAKNVTASVFSALVGQDQTWPSTTWQRLSLTPGGSQTLSQNTADDELIFGPFTWHPDFPWSYSFLVQVDTDGDLSNTNQNTQLPCARGPTPLSMLVPLDNNIGLRSIKVP